MTEPSGMDAWMRAAKVVNDIKPPKGVGAAMCHDPVSFVLAYREECIADAVQTHRKRDELVVAALKLELERGCATGGGVGLAARVLAIYEEVPL